MRVLILGFTLYLVPEAIPSYESHIFLNTDFNRIKLF